MDEPTPTQEQPDERTVTPAEVWEQLSPDVQARVMSLLGRMAYKYMLSSRQQSSKDEDCGNDGEK